jgi:integrase
MTRQIRPYAAPSSALADSRDPTFNFALALPGRASSRHSQRAYFRWVDQYLADVAGVKPTHGISRAARMSALPVPVLQRSLSAPQLRAWLGMLVAAGHGKQGVNQARAAVCTLAELLAETGWLDDYISAGMNNVKLPRAEDGQRPGRWLSPEQVHRLMSAGREVATSENQEVRNQAIMALLCTMALRREELAVARWRDVTVQNKRAVLYVHGKGRKVAPVDMPRVAVTALERWHKLVQSEDQRPLMDTPLIRRVWKGGRISRTGLTPDGIWLIVREAADYADLGVVAPHDLRRSVAGALQQAGVSVEKISRLLRHSNIAVTERYLSRLPQRNEGAILMSELLGFEEGENE